MPAFAVPFVAGTVDSVPLYASLLLACLPPPYLPGAKKRPRPATPDMSDRMTGRTTTDEGGGEYEKGGKMRRNQARKEEWGDVTTVVHPSDGVIVCMCTYVMRAHRIRKAVQLLSGAQAQGPQQTSATKYISPYLGC